MNSRQYSCSDGCCICAVKQSTSNFKPWNRRFTEDELCRVFGLKTMEGRRGLICNPCILYINRALTNIKQGVGPKDYSHRLDCKASSQAKKESKKESAADDCPMDSQGGKKYTKGYVATHLRLTPRYVYTQKPYIKLKSKAQLVPPGPWQDPKEMLEIGDDPETDLPLYRRVTLTKEKTLEKQKMHEKKKQEKFLAARLGSPSKVTARQKSQARENKKQQKQQQQRELARKRRQKQSLVSHKKASLIDSVLEDEPTISHNTSEDSQDQLTNPGAKSGKRSPCPAPQLRKLEVQSSSQSGFQPPGPAPAANRRRRLNRRVMRAPVRNLKPRDISFMDCSYWQKFTFCCHNLYAGENGQVVLNMTHDMKDCPNMKMHMARLKEKEEAERAERANENKGLEEDRMEDESIEGNSSEDKLEEKQKKRKLGKVFEKEEECCQEELVVEQKKQKTESLYQTDGHIGKEELGEVSPLSSGDDELNDSRSDLPSSPLTDASLLLANFQFFSDPVNKDSGM